MKKTKKSRSTTPKTPTTTKAKQRVQEIRQVTDAILDSVVTGGVRDCCGHDRY